MKNHEYGLVLLKPLKLLRSEPETAPPAVTYAGEREFADMKRRMEKIAVVLLAVHTHSYARCNESKDIMEIAAWNKIDVKRTMRKKWIDIRPYCIV